MGLREARHHAVADDEVEHGVAEELEALVVLGARLALLVAPARVAQRLLEQRAVPERVAEHGFELGVIGHDVP